jgi:hypothetical protein
MPALLHAVNRTGLRIPLTSSLLIAEVMFPCTGDQHRDSRQPGWQGCVLPEGLYGAIVTPFSFNESLPGLDSFPSSGGKVATQVQHHHLIKTGHQLCHLQEAAFAGPAMYCPLCGGWVWGITSCLD